MSIWHWLVIVIFVGILAVCFGALRRRKRDDPDELTKVHGWLALLVAGMMFLGPLMGASRISGDLSSTETQYPQLLSVEGWATYKNATWLVFAIASLVTIYAGSRLAYSRKRRAVPIAIAALWISGPVAALVMGVVIPLVIFGKSGADSEVAGGIFASAVMATIWTLYLLLSKRVKARYVEVASPTSVVLPAAE